MKFENKAQIKEEAEKLINKLTQEIEELKSKKSSSNYLTKILATAQITVFKFENIKLNKIEALRILLSELDDMDEKTFFQYKIKYGNNNPNVNGSDACAGASSKVAKFLDDVGEFFKNTPSSVIKMEELSSKTSKTKLKNRMNHG